MPTPFMVWETEIWQRKDLADIKETAWVVKPCLRRSDFKCRSPLAGFKVGLMRATAVAAPLAVKSHLSVILITNIE
jgi:hypothetical protein